jgi:hypothetical protein
MDPLNKECVSCDLVPRMTMCLFDGVEPRFAEKEISAFGDDATFNSHHSHLS